MKKTIERKGMNLEFWKRYFFRRNRGPWGASSDADCITGRLKSSNHFRGLKHILSSTNDHKKRRISSGSGKPSCFFSLVDAIIRYCDGKNCPTIWDVSSSENGLLDFM